MIESPQTLDQSSGQQNQIDTMFMYYRLSTLKLKMYCKKIIVIIEMLNEEFDFGYIPDRKKIEAKRSEERRVGKEC